MAASMISPVIYGISSLFVKVERYLSNNLLNIVNDGFANKTVDEHRQLVLRVFASNTSKCRSSELLITWSQPGTQKDSSSFDVAIAAATIQSAQYPKAEATTSYQLPPTAKKSTGSP